MFLHCQHMDCSTIEADDNVEDTARMSCEIQCNSLLRNQQDALPTVSHQNSTFISCHPCDCNLDAQFGFDGMCFHWLLATSSSNHHCRIFEISHPSIATQCSVPVGMGLTHLKQAPGGQTSCLIIRHNWRRQTYRLFTNSLIAHLRPLNTCMPVTRSV